MMLEANGIQLHYDVHGEGEPLLWLHGHMGHGPDWQHIFSSVPEGCRVIAPDLRGHGRSTGESESYSFLRSALDMLALLNHLQIDRVKVIGLSGGGITALHLAVVQPARVAAMVVVSAPPAFPDSAKAAQRAYAEQSMPEGLRRIMRARHARDGQFDALIAQTRRMAEEPDPNFSRKELAAIAADTLIVFGDRDPFYPVQVAVDLKNAIGRSWLWVVPNGGHGPVFGADAPRFAETSLAFLSGKWRTIQP